MSINLNNMLYIYTYLKTSSNNNNKNLILEPLCTIVKLILLSYKPDGTKISIYNNSIQYNEPSIIQGIIRNLNGDKKDDLHNLYHPFLKSFEWYDKNNKIYKYFYEQCVIGLQLLVNVYDLKSKEFIMCDKKGFNGGRLIIFKDI